MIFKIIASLLDPIVAIPCFCIGFFAKGRMRIALSAIAVVGTIILGSSMGLIRSGEDLFLKAGVAALYLAIGWWLSLSRKPKVATEPDA
jgi:hypothetical protein